MLKRKPRGCWDWKQWESESSGQWAGHNLQKGQRQGRKCQTVTWRIIRTVLFNHELAWSKPCLAYSHLLSADGLLGEHVGQKTQPTAQKGPWGFPPTSELTPVAPDTVSHNQVRERILGFKRNLGLAHAHNNYQPGKHQSLWITKLNRGLTQMFPEVQRPPNTNI